MKWAIALLLLTVSPCFCLEARSDAQTVIAWLFGDGRKLKDIPFPEVVEAASGHNVFSLDKKKDSAWLARIAAAVERTVVVLNQPDSPLHQGGRINEASRFIEEQLRVELNREADWKATIPRTAAGGEQSSGYPDILLLRDDGGVVYLDPKLYEVGSSASTLRTFYFEPKMATNKILHDGHHLIVGFQHNRAVGASLRITGWNIVDVSKLLVRFKAEFQASNRDLYRGEAIVAEKLFP